MEIIIQFVLTLLAFLFGGVTDQPSESVVSAQSTTTAMVIRIVDGDTIKVQIDGQEETVRYIGIDTPELHRDGEAACYSQAATDRNTELVAGKQVQLVSDAEDRDKYDRLLRYVYVDELFVNQLLVQEGYATTLEIKPNTDQAPVLERAEDVAREQNLGLWSVCKESSLGNTSDNIPGETEAVTIDTNSLPPGQQKVLDTFGMNGSSVTIAPEVIVCAEAAIGAERVAAIVAGDTPGVLEGLKLANCYRAN